MDPAGFVFKLGKTQKETSESLFPQACCWCKINPVPERELLHPVCTAPSAYMACRASSGTRGLLFEGGEHSYFSEKETLSRGEKIVPLVSQKVS